MTFFILFLGLAFAGFNASRRRWLWMLGAGVSFALAAASRPNWLLYGLIALPVLLAPFFSSPAPFPEGSCGSLPPPLPCRCWRGADCWPCTTTCGSALPWILAPPGS